MSVNPNTILEQIIQKKYQQNFKDWLKNANEKEAKGLQLLGQIYKHQGTKKFKALPPSVQLKKITEQQAFDTQKAEEMFRKNQTTSSYQSEFCQLAKELRPKNNIFNYKKCSQLEFSEFLSQQAVDYIDKWIQQNDELEFQELVLCCLRSINAIVKAQRVHTTEKQDQYIKNNDWDLIRPLRTDKAGAEYKKYKTNQNSIIRQKQKQDELDEKLKQLELTLGKQNLDMMIKKSFKI